MPEQPAAPAPEEVQSLKLRILQVNLNKSEKAHLDIINKRVSKRYNIMLIQEPFTTKFNTIQTLANFRLVYPRNRFSKEAQIRSVI